MVLDCGTHSTKAGFSGECLPRLVIPTVVGRCGTIGLGESDQEGRVGIRSHHQQQDLYHNVGEKDRYYVGCDALVRRSTTTLSKPVQWGRVIDWDAMHQIWRSVIHDHLNVTDPSNHPVLLTESIAEPPRTREIKTEVFFEDFNVPRFSLVTQSVLALYAAGRTSGIVVDIGAGQSSVLPFLQGKSLPQGMVDLGYSGDDITNHLLNSLENLGLRSCSSVHRDLANDIKERLCSISLGNLDSSSIQSAHYTLPDRTVITLDKTQRTSAFQNLFTGPKSVQTSIRKSLSFLEWNTRLSTDIVLSGGTTDSAGFRETLEKLIPESLPIVKSGVEARFMPWVGGSVLGTLETFNRMSVSREEYEEYGSGLINRRCNLEHSLDNSHVLYEFSGT